MKIPTFPKNERSENIFLFGWAFLLLFAFIVSFFQQISNRKNKKAKSDIVKLPLNSGPGKITQPVTPEKPRTNLFKNKKTGHAEPVMFNVDFFQVEIRRKKTPPNVAVKKTEKRRNSMPQSDASSVQLSDAPSLPAEIRFSDKYVYPSRPQDQYQLFPLPGGAQRSRPVANISVDDHSMLIYDTQFGVLTANDFLDKSHAEAHRRCLKNGQVVFAKNLRLFKTHPTGTAGDERVYATNTITNQDGLTLHLFDKIEQHAHCRK